MRSFARMALAACLLTGAAEQAVLAADIPVVVPEPVPEPAVWSGWYLRGDIGFSTQRVDHLDNVLFDDTDNLEFLRSEFDSAPFFVAGFGYEFNRWFRVDLTGEYRGKANYHGLDRYSDPTADGDPDTWEGTNDYQAEKSEWTFLANAYVDLFNWRGVSSYVGVGGGASYNTIHGFTDTNVPNDGEAFANDHGEWHLAWALYAGLAYDVTPNLTVDLGYRYIDLGDARSGDIETFDGVNAVDNPMHFRELTSHDVKLGVRYRFHDEPAEPPVYADY